VLSKVNALVEAMRYSVASAQPDDVWKYSSYKTFMTLYNDVAKEAAKLLRAESQIGVYKLENVPGPTSTILIQQKSLFDDVHGNSLLLKSTLEGEIGYAEDETHKLTSFLQGNLRKAVYGTPEKEIEIQNSIETLVVGRGMTKGVNYDRETGRVRASGKESIPDFVFPDLKLCLEVKLIKIAEKLKATVDEINADIRTYSKLYERQIYVVYDLGVIRDEAESKRGLEDATGVTVLIVKH
jgi:hypothetical protein